ncbi:hypothetical protein DNU06_00265 [Putridiphycobacter roseus]|uniref:Glycosyl transferase family 1 domain-containing protein n=1 Tax=Putridiphycobacter roseus TaxID=2219161 RepID=A0A2W1N356_9FLAO|nr:glycosyltransferase family 4 protein [Putridiphycobacter roseus]PZE18304.1 hypothetical protein DNU06_00265 [Putridiphycobacter roseus]
MNLLILYTKNTKEVFNRKSAIGSYINCLSNILQAEGNTIFLNGIPFNEIHLNETPEQGGSSRGVITRFIPSFIKRRLRDRLVLKKADLLTEELLKSTVKFDVILEFYNLGSQVGVSLSKALNVPLIITYDGPIIEEYEFFNQGEKPFYYDQFVDRQKESLLQAKEIVVYSNPMKDYITAITKNTQNLTIHQNVDFTRFDIFEAEKDFGSKPIKICFIGSFLKWHQVDMLVEVGVDLLKSGKQIEFYLVGDGMERQSIADRVERLEPVVKSKFHLLGFLDGEELFDLKKQMHIGVMPGSNWYGAPNKIFEYGAMNMAVVAPNTPTIKDLFTEKEINFFDWKDQASLAKALANFIDHPEGMEEKAATLQAFILQKYSVDQTRKHYVDLLS